MWGSFPCFALNIAKIAMPVRGAVRHRRDWRPGVAPCQYRVRDSAPLPGRIMTTSLTPATCRASFAIGDEQAAKRVVDLLNESFSEGQAAIGASEGPGGRWDITLHFAE